MLKCPICHNSFNDEDLVGIDFIYTIYHYTCIGEYYHYITDIVVYCYIRNAICSNNPNIH
jgi:hypothetical protein